MQPATDAELMARTSQGDQEAFTLLVDRHKDPLVNTLTRLTGSRDRAEDLAQEAFLRLFQTRERYVEQGRLLPYLYQIATNLVRTEQRRARRWRLLFPVLTASHSRVTDASHERHILRDEAQHQLSAALERLPLTYRVPLVLHEIEGWSYDDIAATCGVAEGTVKSRINRGRNKLREWLTPYWNGETSCTTTTS